MYSKTKEIHVCRANSVDFTGVVSSSQMIESDDSVDSIYDNNNDSNSAMSALKKIGSNQEKPQTLGSTTGPAPESPAPTTGSAAIGANRVPWAPPSPMHSPPISASKMAVSFSSISGSSLKGIVEEKPLLDEIREVLAQSYLIFLLTDLREMSATGRIGTKYEYLAIDSDICKRDTAKQIACLSDNALDHEGHYQGLSPAVIMAIVILEIRDTAVKAAEEKTKSIAKGDMKKKKNRYATTGDIDNDDTFVAYENNKEKKKIMEESMVSLMRCYSRMVSEDLVTEIPSVARRRATLATGVGGVLSPTGANFSNNNNPGSSNMFSRRGGAGGSFFFPSPLSSKMKRGSSAPLRNTLVPVREREVSSIEFDARLPFDAPLTNTDGKDGVSDNVGTDGVSDTVGTDSSNNMLRDSSLKSQNDVTTLNDVTPSATSKTDQFHEGPRKSLFSPMKWSRGDISGDTNSVGSQRSTSRHHISLRNTVKMSAQNSKQIADRIKSDINHQVDNLKPLNSDANTRKEFQELTDIFFDQGEVNEEIKTSLGATYSRSELVDVMRTAVEGRDGKQLQFLSKLFKPGSISQLMVESHARVVWVNDWYPLKELTYAISVDAYQRRVMVVFRGAITSQDWKSTINMGFTKIRNPVKTDFKGKKEYLRVYSGLWIYLFRKRRDTGTTKYDEIANMVHKYGLARIGPDYKLFVTGHSLGGALTHFFSFYASTDERFTKVGPVKAIAFASPYIGGHSWADSFRHQERTKKLQLVQCRNSSDVIPRLPFNFQIGKRGPLWRHVGIGVTIPVIPKCGLKWKPSVHYWGKEKSFLDSTIHGYRRNILFHLPLRLWTLDRSHTLFELQDRLMYGEVNNEAGGGFALLKSTLDELYEKLEENDFETLSKTKWWDRKRSTGETETTSV